MLPVKIKEEKTIFGECKDCGFVAHSAVEFSDHAHECKKDPVPWQAEKKAA
jgi:hypothetical protein